MFVDDLVCMLNLRPLWLFWLGWLGFFELTNDDSGDCLLVDRCCQVCFFVGLDGLVLFLGLFGFRWRV